ncbi:MAG: ERAP1-like C-terminal domain-containing protein [Polyangiaceae bacterium]|nr:ERAP1-like C-terminal domain-containing protein [Polyangiaceae bacterium]
MLARSRVRLAASAALAGALASAGCAAAPAGRQPPPAASARGAADAPAASRAAPAPAEDGRLPPGVRPTRYAVELTVDPAAPRYLGRVRIAVELAEPLRHVVLHARGQRVLVATVRQGGEARRASATARPAAHSVGADEELVVEVERPLAAGAAELDLEFDAPFGDDLAGLYRVQEGGAWYAFTQLEPNDARRVFPCFDEPSFKVPFELALTIPTGQLAFANAPEAQRADDAASGRTTVRFAATEPLPTYLFALAVGPLEVLEGPREPVPLRLVAAKGKAALGKAALDVAAAQLPLLAEWFARPYPYGKLDIVAVPQLSSGAMENAGLVTFREEFVLLEDRAAPATRRALDGIMAHELAHQWFGNWVTLAWWDDIWLNEAFATWMGSKVLERHRPEYPTPQERAARTASVMALDALPGARRIRQPVRSTSDAREAFDGITYVKGAALLHMIEGWIGEAVFQRGVRDYVTRHGGGNAAAPDLYRALSAASGRDVAGVMGSFTEQTGVPVVTATATCAARPSGRARPRLRLAQAPYRALGVAEAEGVWDFPVAVRVGAAGRSRVAVLPITEGELELEDAECAGWWLANAGARGYHRVALGAEQLLRLAPERPLGLEPAERVALASDAWASVVSGALGADAYVSWLESWLRPEEDRIVWETALDGLATLDATVVSDAARPALRARVARLVAPRARRLGWKVRPGEPLEVRRLRGTLLGALVTLTDDPWAHTEGRRVAEAWLAAPASVEPDVARVAVLAYAGRAGASEVDALLARVAANASPEQRLIALAGLAAVSDPAQVERVLQATLDGRIRAADLRYVHPELFARRASQPVAWRWVRSRIAELRERLPQFAVARTSGVIAGLCDEALVSEAEAFFQRELRAVEASARGVALAAQAGRLCAARRRHHAPLLDRAFGAGP